MAYVDGYLLAVPTANKAQYKEHAQMFMDIFKKDYGMLHGVECWGDDVPQGELTSMPMAVKCKEDETVVFSWVVWPDKATRDLAWQKCEQDDRFKDMAMPFDGKRMIFGGFNTLVEG